MHELPHITVPKLLPAIRVRKAFTTALLAIPPTTDACIMGISTVSTLPDGYSGRGTLVGAVSLVTFTSNAAIKRATSIINEIAAHHWWMFYWPYGHNDIRPTCNLVRDATMKKNIAEYLKIVQEYRATEERELQDYLSEGAKVRAQHRMFVAHYPSEYILGVRLHDRITSLQSKAA